MWRITYPLYIIRRSILDGCKHIIQYHKKTCNFLHTNYPGRIYVFPSIEPLITPFQKLNTYITERVIENAHSLNVIIFCNYLFGHTIKIICDPPTIVCVKKPTIDVQKGI